ncbi:MAG: AmmeMemoRadiSam system protein A [Gammaproteobacteria bacterium]|nr:AmmeMemoRadiSam system protein A [Gammaproteobacteria bacterium]
MLNDNDKNTLLDLAAASIKQGLETGSPLKPDSQDYSPDLQAQRACFVTLHIKSELRGCIGSLEAWRSLVEDVAENAYAAAFRDPRFPALSENEFDQLEYHISILTPSEPVAFDSQADLLEKIHPGIDGLVLEEQGRRGTFLPSVWESLPTTEQFLSHLKLKAGLPADYWSDTIKIFRYTVEDVKR